MVKIVFSCSGSNPDSEGKDNCASQTLQLVTIGKQQIADVRIVANVAYSGNTGN